LEGAEVHAKYQDIDAVIAFAGDGIEGRLRPAGFVRVPRADPGFHAIFKLGDDAVCEFLHRIAPRVLDRPELPLRPGLLLLLVAL
jgi:hypothetical protein